MVKEFNERTIASKELLAALGSIVVEFNDLDGTLTLWLAVLLNPQTNWDTVANTVSNALNFRQKTNLFHAAFKTRFPDKTPFAELDELVKQMSKAAEDRNRVLHGAWSESETPDTGLYVRWKPPKSGVRAEHSYQSASAIEALAEEMNSIKWNFARFASYTIGVSGFNQVDYTGRAQRPSARTNRQ